MRNAQSAKFLIGVVLLAWLAEASATPTVSVRSLDLTRPPTRDELMAAGQLGGALTPVGTIADRAREDAVNHDFGHAIEQWNRHAYRAAVERFRRHVAQFPESPWADEANLHVACDATYHARYPEAEALLGSIIARHAGQPAPERRQMLGKARQRLAIVKMAQHDFDAARALFRDLRAESPDWRHRTYASDWILRLKSMSADRLALLNCGVRALAGAIESRGRPAEARAIAALLPATARGFSLDDLAGLAATYGLAMAAVELGPGDLRQADLPAVLHIPGRGGGVGGHYWLLEAMRGDDAELLDAQSGNRFRQTVGELATQWNGSALVFSDRAALPGRLLTRAEMQGAWGGCCGAPTPPDDLGNPGPDRGPGPDGPGPAPNPPPDLGPNPGPGGPDGPGPNGPPGPDSNGPNGGPTANGPGGGGGPGNGAGKNGGPFRIHDKEGSHWALQNRVRHIDGQPPRPAYDRPPYYERGFSEWLNDGWRRWNEQPRVEDPENSGGSSAGSIPARIIMQEDGGPGGAPRWAVNMVNLNLFVEDMPLWYDNPAGPRVAIRLSYNSQTAIVQHEPFGNKWMFNYGSYLVVDTAGSVIVFMPDGRADVYHPDGSGGYTPPPRVYTRLVKRAENDFELRFPDDAVYVYRIPSGTASLQPFLTELRDANGLALRFGYDTNVNLIAITDAWSRVTSLAYSNGLVTRVDDPFGRASRFEYDGDANLRRITDMGGYWSAFTYDSNVYLTAVSNAAGAWQFRLEPADGLSAENSDKYPPPGGSMFENYRLTLTDPLGNRSEYFWYGGCDAYQGLGCAGFSWYVDPRHYVPWESPSVNNYDSRAPKTCFVPRLLPSAGGGVARGRIERVVYPGGGEIRWAYDPLTHETVGASNSLGHAWSYAYNARGRVTRETDPDGRETRYAYGTNGVDLLVVSNAIGRWQFAYDGRHQVTTVVDEVGATLRLLYNGYGQVTQAVDAAGVPTVFAYDGQQRLVEARADGQFLAGYGYDAVGRLRTVSNAAGAVTTRSYDALDLVTNVVHADGAATRLEYSALYPRILERLTERDGSTWRLEYDAVLRRVRVYDRMNRAVGFAYDAAGNLVRMTDVDGRFRTWEYDKDHGVVAFADAQGHRVTLGRDARGLVAAVTNASGGVVRYQHDWAGRVTNEIEQGVSRARFAYDAAGALIRAEDAQGTNLFTRDARGLILAHRQPDGRTVSNTFDLLRRRTALAYPGGPTVAYAYDRLGRLTNAAWGADGVGFAYDAASRLILQTNRNGAWSAFGYDLLDQVTGIAHHASAGPVAALAYARDLMGRVTNSACAAGALPAPPPAVATNRFGVIDSANRMIQWEGAAQSFNADGGLTNRAGAAPLRAVYDVAQRLTNLVAGATNRFAYDAFGARIRRVSGAQTNATYFDAAGRPLYDTEGTGTVAALNLYARGQLIARGLPAGGYRHYHFDAYGNTLALTDGTGGVAAAYAYHPYGGVAARRGETNHPHTFAGAAAVRAESADLFWLRHRLYDAGSGRALAAVLRASSDASGVGGTAAGPGRSSFDPMGRVTRFAYTNGATVDYVYDGAGNRLQETVTPPGGPSNQPPPAAANPSVSNQSVQVTTTPVLSWTVGADPDPGDRVVCDVYLGAATNPPLVSSGWVTNVVPGQLRALTTYRWFVVTRDSHNEAATSTVWTFTTTNASPVASFTAAPTNGYPPLPVLFHETSTSLDDAIVAWRWDFDGNGTVDSTERHPTHTYTNGGLFTVTLRVVDEHAATGILAVAGMVVVGGDDLDGDGWEDAWDNCPYTRNPGQEDDDSDGIGNECDPDIDGDGVLNEVDNCPVIANPAQADSSGVGFGDDCRFDYCAYDEASLAAFLYFAGQPGAVNHTVIHLRRGVYRLSANGSNTFQYASGDPCTLMVRGGYDDDLCQAILWTNDPSLTVLDGEGLAQVLNLVNSNASPYAGIVLENLTITGGSSGTNWGGGALLATRGGKIRLQNCVVVSNAAERGGGVYARTDAGDVTVESCRIEKNRADVRAGFWAQAASGRVTVVNSLVAGNAATLYAAGLAVNMSTGTVTLVNNTISDNGTASAWGPGAGVHLDIDGARTRTILVNNIVWSNGAPAGSGLFIGSSATSPASAYHSAYESNRVAGALSNETGNVFVDPLFVNAAGGDFRLLPVSPCINAGTTNYAATPTHDLAGHPRPLRGYTNAAAAVDMGALEYVFNAFDDFDGDGLTDSNELQYGTSPILADTDGDRMSDRDEVLAGTQPTNAASWLGLAPAPPPGSGGPVVRWPSVAGKRYNLDRATNLVLPGFAPLRTNIPAVPPMNTETDASAVGTSPHFYRVRLQP